VNSFTLTFTTPLGSVHVDEQPTMDRAGSTNTLTAYDASNNVAGTDSAFGVDVNTLTVTSTTNNIKYVTIATDDAEMLGLAFTNIVWGCN